MLELKSLNVKEGGFVETVYSATHSTPGRSGTFLELEVCVVQNQRMGKTWVEVGGMRPELNTLDTGEALDKLAEWAERLAVALRHRGPATAVVVAFNDPQQTSPVQG
tara:strand:+ start:4332 stop:4652 length:321 start_codon:yes stop_codon:yes gene_type:complete